MCKTKDHETTMASPDKQPRSGHHLCKKTTQDGRIQYRMLVAFRGGCLALRVEAKGHLEAKSPAIYL